VTVRLCGWKPCRSRAQEYSPYCPEHAEQARRNVLRALGVAAPRSLMWRKGDEEWLFEGLAGKR